MITRTQMLEWAGRYADGIATAEEVAALSAALRNDADLRRAFVRYMNVDAALGGAIEAWRTAEQQGAAAAPPKGSQPLTTFTWATAIAALAAVLLLGIGAWAWIAARHAGPVASVGNPRGLVDQRGSDPPAVVLTASTEARWADPDAELSLRGGEVPAGLLRLESGVAEFRFARGATAVLLGPASVRFGGGGDQVFLQDGKALCRCPTPQSRLTLTTPATQIVDLGTEFAVDASADSGTRVAVVSGKVQIGTADPRLLEKGQSAVVGPDKVVRLTPLPPDAFAELFRADPSRPSPLPGVGNLLADPGFERVAPGGAPWVGTEGYAEPLAARGSVGGAAIHARSHRLWPSFRQTVATGDIAGRLVVATVEGTSALDDPLCERQSAILKISFIDAAGREFASASRHFLSSAAKPGVPVVGNVAAFAPAGTRKVQYQIMLSARSQPAGTVIFRGPSLLVGAAPGHAATQP